MVYPISNLNTPYNNVDGSIVNVDNSHTTNMFSSHQIPNGPHTMPPPGNNVQSAAGIYPCAQSGGRKINRRKINKLSRKYKMRRSNRASKRMRASRRRRASRRMRASRRTRRMYGGAAVAPNYPGGHVQFDNNRMLSNNFSTGGILSKSLSALASPPPYSKLAPEVDNLNHNALNAFGKSGAGSGFPSRGWF